ncbi:hypothetical protein EON65_24715 [archaeon]|nr:MAG: hypothetical protein EON65_24715 [archaeon]
MKATRSRTNLHAENQWWLRPNEVQLTGVIGDSPSITVPNNGDNWRYDSEEDDEYDEDDDEKLKINQPILVEDDEAESQQASYGFPCFTLRQVSEIYGFSLAYLGDFVVSSGCPSPIDVDVKMNSYMSPDQMTQLLTAVNSVDPVQASLSYQESLPEICAYFGLSVERVLEICAQQGILLPFGASTVLHAHLAEQVRQAIEFQDE